MANGGTSGGDLERLRVQVDATRTELGEIAGAISGLTELVTDLIRRSAVNTDHQGERWQARLGSLETRLEMLETAIRVEVERIRASAGAVDALADDFKATVGGTHNLVDLAATISDRIASLDALERGVRSATGDIAAAVEARLDHEASSRERRDATLADRVGGVLERIDQLAEAAREQATARARLDDLDHSISQTHESLAVLAARLEGVAQVTADLPAIENRLAAQLRDTTTAGQSSLATTFAAVSSELAGWRAELDATSEVNRREFAGTLSELLTEVRGLGTRIEEAGADDSRLADIAAALAQVRAHQPELAARLDGFARDLDHVHAALAQPDEALGVIGDRLDALAAALRDAVAQQPDPTTAVEQLAAEVAALRATQPDPSDHLERIAVELARLRDEQPDPAGPLDRLTQEIAGLRAEQPDLNDGIRQVREEIATLRDAIPDSGALAERISYLLDQQAAALIDLQAAQPRAAERLDRITSEIAQLRAGQPELVVDLEPIARRIDALGDQLTQLRAGQPAADAVIGHVASVLNEHSTALSQIQAGQPQLAVRLDQLAADLAELRADDGFMAAAVAPLAQRVESLHGMVQEGLTPAPDVRPSIDQLAAAVAELRDLVAGRDDERAAGHDAQLARLAEVVQDIRARQPDLALRFDQVQAELADLRTRIPDPTALLAPLAERLDRIAVDAGRLHETPLALDRIAAEVAELRAGQPDAEAAAAGVAAIAHSIRELADDIARLRAAQPDAVAIVSPLHGRLDELAVMIDLLQSQLASSAAEPVDVASAIEPLRAALVTVDGRAAATTDAVLQLEAAFARTTLQVDEVVAGLTALRERPDQTPQAVAAIADRLAGVVESVSSMQAEVTNLSDSVSSLKGDRSQLIEVSTETNGRLDVLATKVGELRESRPDLTASFVALSGVLESVQANVTSTHDRIDALTERIRQDDAGRVDVASAVAPLGDRLDGIATQVATSEHNVAAALQSVAEALGRVEGDRAAAVTQQIDEVRQAVNGSGDRQMSALLDMTQRFEQLSASTVSTQEVTRSIEAALASAPHDDDAERFGEFGQQIGELSSAVKSTVRAIVGLGADVTALRSDLESLASRDAGVHDLLGRLDAAVTDSNREVDVSALTRQLDAAIMELRRDLQSVSTAASSTDVLDMVRSLAGRDPSEALQPLDAALREVRADLRSTRTEVQSMNAALGDLRAQARRSDDQTGGAGAALVASAASAMARLEDRIDSEFDNLSHQMEALGTLLGQVIEAVHRVETQVVGVHPVSEKMRTAAASVLETLRANVRQRASRRNSSGAPPPELGAGPS